MSETSPLPPFNTEWLLGIVVATTVLGGLAVVFVLVGLLVRDSLRRAK